MRKSEVTFKWVVSSCQGSKISEEEMARIDSAMSAINMMSETFFDEMLKHWKTIIPKISTKTSVAERVVRYAYISALDRLVKNIKDASWKSGIDGEVFGCVLKDDYEFELEDEDLEGDILNKEGFH